MKTAAELVAYALRYLADDCDDHRPRTAQRMRNLAAVYDANAVQAVIEAYRDLHAQTCDDYWSEDECACGGRQLLAKLRVLA